MCTLILLHREIAGLPVVVAANRDERLARPAEGPALRIEGPVAVVSPLDLEAGGTWLGVNANGVLAALTNRPVSGRDTTRRSRGLLVLDALESSSAAAAAEALGSLPVRRYNPFNLIVADREDAFAIVYEDVPQVLVLEPGVHVICNADPNDRDVPKIDRLLGRATEAARAGRDQVLEALATVCRSHDGKGAPYEDTCIHSPDYGTRSSLLLGLSESGADDELYYAEGPPCSVPYQDHASLLRELRRNTRPHAGNLAARSNR